MIDTRLNTAYLQQLERKTSTITQVVEDTTHTRAGFTFKYASKAGQSYMMEFYYNYKDVTNSKTVCTVKMFRSVIKHTVKFVDSITSANVNNLKHAAELLAQYATSVIDTALTMLDVEFDNTLDTTNDDVPLYLQDFVNLTSNMEIDGKVVGGQGVTPSAKRTDLLAEQFGGIAAARLYKKILNRHLLNETVCIADETITENSYTLKHRIERITKHYCSTGAAYLAYRCINDFLAVNTNFFVEQNNKAKIEGPNVEFPMHIFVYDVISVAAANTKD